MNSDDDQAATTSAQRTLYRYRFGSAEFDELRQELRVAGLLVDVQHKPLQLLSEFLARPRTLLTKDELLHRVWGGVIVEEGSLANAVSKLRAALGEANASAVVTVARQGYRFDTLPMREAIATQMSSRLHLHVGQAVPGRDNHRLLRLLGRSRSNETWLASQSASSELRVYKFALDGQMLTDLKREARVYRHLRDELGERSDIAQVLNWNFEQPPFWIESAWAGISLSQWASEAAPDGSSRTRLAAASRSERLDLVLQMATAVSAANDAGIVHGDLKPENVLLSASGERAWTVCLTDFGSARPLNPEQLAGLRLSQLNPAPVDEHSISLGTPLYMAPELAQGQTPHVRSDVFALGVMLYQLLAADLQRPLAPGWERDIDDELLRMDIAEATDLDPTLRLSSAEALAARIRDLPARRAQAVAKHLEDQKNAADRAAQARTRARRPWVAAAIAALALGTVSSLWLYWAERRSERALAHQLAYAQALNELLRDDLVGAANPARSGRAGISVADALKTAADGVDARFAGQPPAVRAGLHAAMQAALSELSQSAQAVVAGRRALAAWQSDTAPDRAAVQALRLRLALDLVQLSNLDEARAVVAEIERDAAPLAQQPPVFRARLLYVRSWLSGGELALQQSADELRAAWQLVQPYTEAQAPWREKIMYALADNLVMLGRGAEGEALLRQLMAEQIARDGPASVRGLVTGVGLGKALAQQGKKAQAAAVLDDSSRGLSTALGPGHRLTLDARDLLAGLRYDEGHFREAAAEWSAVQAGITQLLGPGSSYTLSVQTNRARALRRSGEALQAEPLLSDALTRARAFLKDAAPQVQEIRFELADCLLELHRPAEAAPLVPGLDADALNLAEQADDWPLRLQGLRERLARGLASGPASSPARGPARGKAANGVGGANLE